MSTGNQRISQLTELTANEVQFDDLFVIVDVTAKESKKIQASELSLWLNNSGSLYAVHALNADTASFILASNVYGFVPTSSNALSASNTLFAQLANLASASISASYSKTASFALNSAGNLKTASFLLYSGVPNGTASWALTANTANSAPTASFLVYFAGGNNGTASFAMTASNVRHAIIADTASYVAGGPTATASYATVAQEAYLADSATVATSASFLIFNPAFPANGTASYALAAGTLVGTSIVGQGIFLATTQSTFVSQLDDIDIYWSTGNPAVTTIEAMGNINVPFTSSNPTNATISLVIQDRNTGFQTLLDYSPIMLNITSNGTSNTNSSGSVKLPFSLMGQASLYGSYMVFVSASYTTSLSSIRPVRFNIASQTDTFASYPNSPFTFSVTPSTTTLTYTVGGNLFTGTAANVVAAGVNNVRTVDGISQGISSIDYLWTLNNVTESNFSFNPLLTHIGGVPSSMLSFNCSNCALTNLYTFVSSSLSYLYCSNNLLTALPGFPLSMSYLDCSSNQINQLNLPLTLSYLDCSNNPFNTLPSGLPSGSAVLITDNNNLQYFPSLPDTLITMSANNNASLTIPPFSLPQDLTYLSMNGTPIGSLPTLPTGILYLSVNNSGLLSFVMDSIASQLVTNGLNNGYVDLTGNGTPSPSAQANLTTLHNGPRNWTTLYDP